MMTEAEKQEAYKHLLTCDGRGVKEKQRLLNLLLEDAGQDSKRIDHIAAYWNSQHTGGQYLLGGRAVSNPTGSFRDAIDADINIQG